MWKKKIPFTAWVSLAGLVSILMLLAVVASPGCRPSLAGDWGLRLHGVVSSPGWVGYEVEDKLFSVNVETGDTAEQIGPRLAAVMRAAGLLVDCERFADCGGVYDGECYTFILRDAHGPLEHESQAQGIGGGSCGPIIDERFWIESQAKGFYAILNANKGTQLRDITTVEYRQDALDVMASMAASGEQIIIDSVESVTVDCYQATVCLHLIRVVGTEKQPVDTCLTLTRLRPCWEWLISGGIIR